MRYMFASSKEIKKIATLLKGADLNELEPYSSVLLQLMSQFFKIDIVLHQDLSSAPTKYYSSKGYLRSELASSTIHLAYNSKENEFKSVDIRQSREFLELKKPWENDIALLSDSNALPKAVDQARKRLFGFTNSLSNKTVLSEAEKEFIRYLKQLLR